MRQCGHTRVEIRTRCVRRGVNRPHPGPCCPRKRQKSPGCFIVCRQYAPEGVRRVDITPMLYRYSRLAGVPIDYQLESLNCHVISNFLIAGEQIWAHETPQSRFSFLLRNVNRTDTITLQILYDLEAELRRVDL